MPERREISPLWIIPIGIILGIAAGMGLVALAWGEVIVSYIKNISISNPPSREGERIHLALSAELQDGYVYRANFVSPELKEPKMLTVPVGQEVGYLPISYSRGTLEGAIWAADCVNPVLVDSIDGEYHPPSSMTGEFQIEVYSALPDYSAIIELVHQTAVPATLYS